MIQSFSVDEKDFKTSNGDIGNMRPNVTTDTKSDNLTSM